MGLSPRNSTLFPKSGNSQKQQNRHFISGKQECPFYRHSQNQNPRNMLPKVAFGEISMFRGKAIYPPEANFPILSPFFPKIQSVGKIRLHLEHYPLVTLSLNAYFPLFSRLSLSNSLNKKRPHRKDHSSLQGRILYFIFTSGAAPICPHRIIRFASG